MIPGDGAAFHQAISIPSGTPPCQLSPSGATVANFCNTPASLHTSVAYFSIGPILILFVGALVLLTVAAVLPKRSRPGLWSLLTVAVGGAATIFSAFNWADVSTHGPHATFGQQVLYDHFSVLFYVLVGSATVIGALLSDSYLQREGLDGPEAYVLMLLCGSGAMLMAASGGLVMLFLGLEILSISLYVLAAYHRRRLESGEAGLKYFILGSFSSAIFLYGAALVYGATGSTQFGDINRFLANNTLANSGVLLGGMALLIVGLGFKVAAVPFHFWTPDVYQGAPTPFTGYMGAVAKAAGFAGLLRVLVEALPSQEVTWRPVIWGLTVLTLVVGSVLALVQSDLKRMLAYSSISQAGYVLIGLQAASADGTSAALFYLLTYTFIVMGSFAVVQLIQGPGEARNDLGAIRGLAKRRPGLALIMVLFLMAQAGVPFTSGFLAKFVRHRRRDPAGPVSPGHHRHAGRGPGRLLLPADRPAHVRRARSGGRGRGGGFHPGGRLERARARGRRRRSLGWWGRGRRGRGDARGAGGDQGEDPPDRGHRPGGLRRVHGRGRRVLAGAGLRPARHHALLTRSGGEHHPA